MSSFLLFGATSIGLLCLGLYHLLVRREPIARLLALNVMSSGTFLLLVAIARRNAADVLDPVPQALVLTGIVVAVSVTALALAIIRRMEAIASAAMTADEEIE